MASAPSDRKFACANFTWSARISFLIRWRTKFIADSPRQRLLLLQIPSDLTVSDFETGGSIGQYSRWASALSRQVETVRSSGSDKCQREYPSAARRWHNCQT